MVGIGQDSVGLIGTVVVDQIGQLFTQSAAVGENQCRLIDSGMVANLLGVGAPEGIGIPGSIGHLGPADGKLIGFAGRRSYDAYRSPAIFCSFQSARSGSQTLRLFRPPPAWSAASAPGLP